MLYQRHPEVEHADYVVRYVCWPHPGSRSGTISGLDDQVGACPSARLRWPELMAAVRVAGQVRKRLLLLYVQFPADVDLKAPSCMQQAQVRTRFVLKLGSDKRQSQDVG